MAATPSARLQGVKIYSQKRHCCPNDDKIVYFSSFVQKNLGEKGFINFLNFMEGGRGAGGGGDNFGLAIALCRRIGCRTYFCRMTVCWQ